MRFIALAIGCLTLLSGCIPYSDNPLSPPLRDPLDSRLFGTWYYRTEEETGYLHFGPDSKSRLMRIIMIEFNKNGDLDYSEYTAHSTTVGKNTYLNVKGVDTENNSSGYLFVKYTVTEGNLGISIIDSELVSKAIKEGTIKGEIGSDRWTTSIRIKDEPENLVKFIEKHDKELFPETSNLRRLDAPRTK